MKIHNKKELFNYIKNCDKKNKKNVNYHLFII